MTHLPDDRSDRTAALFVRIPRAQAERLDRAAFALKLPKQELVSGLLEHYVDPTSPEGLHALRALGAAGAGRRRVTVKTDDGGLTVGQHSFQPRAADVLTLEEVAELLRVEPELVLTLAESGELPGRPLADEWRFARHAVLNWLARREATAPQDG